jgi:hypothetical protein
VHRVLLPSVPLFSSVVWSTAGAPSSPHLPI